MLISTYDNIELYAVSCAVPNKTVSAKSIYKKHGQEYTEKISKNVAVESVRVSIKKQISSDLGYVAAKKLLDDYHIDTAKIGVLVYVTQTPDYRMPATSCILHKRLMLSHDCATVDVNNGCAGFVYGANIACAMLDKIDCGYALLINGDTSTPKKILRDNYSRRVSVPFGDATTAVLFKKSNNAEPIQIALRSNGGGYHSLIEYGSGFRALTYSKSEMALGRRSKKYPLMNGVEVFNFSITDVPNLINEFAEHNGKAASDYDYIILHQPNLYMIKQISKKINVSMDKVPISLYRYGNTSGASIPLTLVDRFGECEGEGEGEGKSGAINTLMCGFGVGLMWGVMSAHINTENILPMINSDEYYEDPNIDNYAYDS